MSTRPPLPHDPEVHHQLRRHYPQLLEGRELQIEGAYVEDSTCLGLFSHEQILIIIQGHQQSLDPGHGRDHPYLAPEEAKPLQHYQLAHPCIAWPQPTLSIAIPAPGEAVVTGAEPAVPINLRRAGSIQLWWGGGTGEIWEATLDGVPLENNPLPLHALWYSLETTLRERGCTRSYTLARDPAYPDDAYQAFLRERGYQPSEQHAHRTSLAWVKPLD